MENFLNDSGYDHIGKTFLQSLETEAVLKVLKVDRLFSEFLDKNPELWTVYFQKELGKLEDWLEDNEEWDEIFEDIKASKDFKMVKKWTFVLYKLNKKLNVEKNEKTEKIEKVEEVQKAKKIEETSENEDEDDFPRPIFPYTHFNLPKLDKTDFSPLHIIAEIGNFPLYEQVLPKLTHKNPDGAKGLTPLHIAAQNGNLEMVVSIMKTVDHKSPQDNNGNTPLHYAVMGNYEEIVNYLCRVTPEARFQRNYQFDSPFGTAMEKGYEHLYEYFNVESDFDSDEGCLLMTSPCCAIL